MIFFVFLVSYILAFCFVRTHYSIVPGRHILDSLNTNVNNIREKLENNSYNWFFFLNIIIERFLVFWCTNLFLRRYTQWRVSDGWIVSLGEFFCFFLDTINKFRGYINLFFCFLLKLKKIPILKSNEKEIGTIFASTVVWKWRSKHIREHDKFEPPRPLRGLYITATGYMYLSIGDDEWFEISHEHPLLIGFTPGWINQSHVRLYIALA